MEYLIVLAGGLAALFFLILVFNKGKRTEHWFLSVLFLLMLISCIYMFLLYKSGGAYYQPWFSELNYAIPLLYGVLLWMYTRSLIDNKFRLQRYDLIHLIPFVGFLLYLVTPLLIEIKSETQSDIGYPLIKLIINPIYIFLSLKLLDDYRRDLFEQYSYVNHMHHYWLTWIVYGALLLWIVACFGNVFNWYNGYDTSMLGDYFLIGFLGILMFILAYVGINRTEIFQAPKPVEKEDISKKKQKEPSEENDEYQQLFKNLSAVMVEKKAFLDPTLSLSGLATISNIPQGKLSSVINRVAQKNFYDFVNEYRVQEMKARLANGEQNQYSILGIATECGFNSKASFNRIFKKQTGLTPSEYVSKIPSNMQPI